jgi:hypothetical protein
MTHEMATILNITHNVVAVKHYYSQRWQALEHYLALHNACSVALWHSVFQAMLVVVSVER